MIGGLVASEFQEGIQSTYICPISSGQYAVLRFIRILSVLLDSVILISVSELFWESSRPREGRNKHFLVSCGFGLIVSVLAAGWGCGLMQLIGSCWFLDPDRNYSRHSDQGSD
jgi:hypothetical protein